MRVAIVHANEDEKAAQSIAQTLTARGMRCVMLPANISPGALVAEAVAHEVRQSEAVVAIVSSAAVTSPIVRAVAERAVSSRISLVPVRIDDVQVTGGLAYLLAGSQWHEARGSQGPGELESRLRALPAFLESRRSAGRRRAWVILPLAVLATGICAATLWYVADGRNQELVAVGDPVRAGLVIDLGYTLGLSEIAKRLPSEDTKFVRQHAESIILALGLDVPNIKDEARLSQAVAARLAETYELLCLEVGTDLAMLQMATVGSRSLGGSQTLAAEMSRKAVSSMDESLRSMGIVPSNALPRGSVDDLRRALERGATSGDEEMSRFKVQLMRAMTETLSTSKAKVTKDETRHK